MRASEVFRWLLCHSRAATFQHRRATAELGAQHPRLQKQVRHRCQAFEQQLQQYMINNCERRSVSEEISDIIYRSFQERFLINFLSQGNALLPLFFI